MNVKFSPMHGVGATPSTYFAHPLDWRELLVHQFRRTSHIQFSQNLVLILSSISSSLFYTCLTYNFQLFSGFHPASQWLKWRSSSSTYFGGWCRLQLGRVPTLDWEDCLDIQEKAYSSFKKSPLLPIVSMYLSGSGWYLRWYGVTANQVVEVWLDTRNLNPFNKS